MGMDRLLTQRLLVFMTKEVMTKMKCMVKITISRSAIISVTATGINTGK